MERLKHKFTSLHNHKNLTGDPNCPLLVRKVKQVWEVIKSELDFSIREDPPPPPAISPFPWEGSVAV